MPNGRHRKSKGSVSVESLKGRLRLRWTYKGERKILSLGLRDTPENKRLAQLRAAEIERDIVS
ncbi:MAG: Arm DNA-binding domain-containing protein [Microcoleaceae cyanobacterium]